MSGEHGNIAYLRGSHLLNLGRHEEAASFFREAIAHDTDNAGAYANLARCLMEIEGQKKEALVVIDQAIGVDPEESYHHALRSLILSELKRHAEALDAAKAAVALDPEDAFNHAIEARAHLGRERWKEAEAAARRALAIDGDHDFARNLLATVLRVQGRMDENEIAVDTLLANNPEDPMAHVNAGFSALQRRDHRKAEEHFREALRIDPEFEGARIGLIESFRARSWFYRKYLAYCFFMQRFSSGNRWVIIIGLYLAFRFGRVLMAAIHPLLAVAFVVLYLLFVFWVWLARGVGSFIIMLDKSARLALTPPEKLEGIFVGAGFTAGFTLGLLGAVWENDALLFAGGALACGALPASLVFTNESTKGRVLFGGVLAFVYLNGFGAALGTALAPESDFTALAIGGCLLAGIAVALCTWLGNVRALRE